MIGYRRTRSWPYAVAVLAILAFVAAPSSEGAAAARGPLRVCADANYMPFSDRAGKGFENAIARQLGWYLDRPVSFTFGDERESDGFNGFLKHTLLAHRCDLVVDVPYATDDLEVSDPYYISSYVFVFPKNKHYAITSLDSPALTKLRIGFEEDTPAEAGLKLRALIVHASPFDVGDESGTSPAIILDALERGKIAVALTWEPSIGYFLRSMPNLTVVGVPNSRSTGSVEQYAFPMAMAARPGDTALIKQVNAAIAEHKPALHATLERYGVRLYVPSIKAAGY